MRLGSLGLIATFCLLFLTACSHYRLGDGNVVVAPHSVWVTPVVLETPVADTTVPLNRELRQAVIRSGNLTLARNLASADYHLQVTVREYTRVGTARHPADTELAEIMALEVTVDYIVWDRKGLEQASGSVLSGAELLREDRFAQSERQSKDAMMQMLARDILREAFQVGSL